MYRREYYRRSNRSEHLPPGYGPALLIAEWGNLSSLNSRKFTQRRHSHLTKLGDRHTCVPFFPLRALCLLFARASQGGAAKKATVPRTTILRGNKERGYNEQPGTFARSRRSRILFADDAARAVAEQTKANARLQTTAARIGMKFGPCPEVPKTPNGSTLGKSKWKAR